VTQFYTRKGDDGTTSWIGKGRLKKFDLRFETLGTLDETSASLGLARGLSGNAQVKEILLHVQRDLSGMMGEVAADLDQAERFRTTRAEQVTWLEKQADTVSEMVESPRSFLMSGDTPGGGALDHARAVSRRAERCVVEMTDAGSLNNPFITAYLNRLSSLLFVLELLELKTCCPEPPSEAK
jgi:cob(I)alamin adenosyltransferase